MVANAEERFNDCSGRIRSLCSPAGLVWSDRRLRTRSCGDYGEVNLSAQVSRRKNAVVLEDVFVIGWRGNLGRLAGAPAESQELQVLLVLDLQVTVAPNPAKLPQASLVGTLCTLY